MYDVDLLFARQLSCIQWWCLYTAARTRRVRACVMMASRWHSMAWSLSASTTGWDLLVRLSCLRVFIGKCKNDQYCAYHCIVVSCFDVIDCFVCNVGFLTTGNDILEGNFGLYDQIEALGWIADNIHRFRGNASSVTLFGSSAGSSSIGLLMTIPQTEGIASSTLTICTCTCTCIVFTPYSLKSLFILRFLYF